MNYNVTIEYPFIDRGRENKLAVNYDLVFSEQGKLLKVYNEFHHSIEEISECFINFKKNEQELFKLAKMALEEKV